MKYIDIRFCITGIFRQIIAIVFRDTNSFEIFCNNYAQIILPPTPLRRHLNFCLVAILFYRWKGISSPLAECFPREITKTQAKPASKEKFLELNFCFATRRKSKMTIFLHLVKKVYSVFLRSLYSYLNFFIVFICIPYHFLI